MATLPEEQLIPLKQKIASKIDWGNEQLHLDYVPRAQSGDPVDPQSCSFRQLYDLHPTLSSRGAGFGSKARKMSQVGSAGHDKADSTFHHHVYVNTTGMVFPQISGEDVELLLSIYDVKRERYVSERFGLRFNKSGAPEPGMSLCCLFYRLGFK